MSDYIDRQAAIEAINKAFDRKTLLNSFVRKIAVDAIKELPSVEVEPVKHGKWEHKSIGGWHCSECGEQAPFWCFATTQNLANYCPNCGAKMEPISASPENSQEQRRSPDASL